MIISHVSHHVSHHWNTFFHARTHNNHADKLGGCMRIGFAVLYLCDRLLWTLDIHELLSPTSGLIPYNVGRSIMDERYQQQSWSLLSLAPESDAWLWTLHGLSLLHGILLLLGVSPRVQLLAIFVNMISFHNANLLVIDRQDVMFRIWAFLLFFLPLHEYSIFQSNGTSCNSDSEHDKKKAQQTTTPASSWPMWPFRLWQLQVCLIYQGASWGKLHSPTWLYGNAMWRITHMADFFGGVVNPDFIFDRLGPLKLMCWSSLVIECLCWITIWPLATRRLTLMAIVALHVGIELTMNMHCFEWLSIMGWMPFLVSPAPTLSSSPTNSNSNNHQKISNKKTNKTYQLFINIFLVALLVANTAQCNAVTHLEVMAPPVLKPVLNYYNTAAQWLQDNCVHPITVPLGLYQYTWDLYEGDVDTRQKTFVITVTLQNGETVIHKSPDWSNMTWYVKKRYQRKMDYVERLGNTKPYSLAHKRPCEIYANMYDNVATVQLHYAWRVGALVPPSDLHWWWSPGARATPVHFEKEEFYTLDVLHDADLRPEEECPARSGDDCHAQDDAMCDGHCASSSPVLTAKDGNTQNVSK